MESVDGIHWAGASRVSGDLDMFCDWRSKVLRQGLLSQSVGASSLV